MGKYGLLGITLTSIMFLLSAKGQTKSLQESVIEDNKAADIQRQVIDKAVDEVINQYIGNKDFAGVVLVADGVERIHAAAYGEVLPGSGIPHKVDSEWRWASVTKMLAGFITLQEVERGRLNLDQTLAEILPHAPTHVGDVTLRQLMNHTSGLANPDQTVKNTKTGVHEWASAAEPDFAYCYRPALAAPGKRFDYNACDFVVLADVLKAVTGQNFAELINQRLNKAYRLTSIRVVTEASDDAEVVGIKGGKRVRDGLRLANLSADAAIVGKPTDLLKLTRLFMAGDIISDPNLLQEFGRGTPEFGYIGLTVWGYQAQLKGCSKPVKVIERQGHLPGTKVLTLQAPELTRSLVLFSNREETDWGWIWQQSGLSFDLASEVFCR